MMLEADSSPRRHWLRPTLWAFALCAAIVGSLWWWTQRDAGADAGPKFTTQPAGRGDVIPRVTATGTLSPVVTVQVGSQVSGRIKELFADFNDEVKAGQVIARLDPALFESAVARAKAQLATARANLDKAEATAENARAEYKRLQDLHKRGVASKAELDVGLANKLIAEATITSARADVTQARAALEETEANLSYTTIASPIDGVVVTRSVDVGQTVAASLSAPVLFLIAGDLRKMEVHASVAESDVGQIEPEMKAEFTVDAFPSDRFVGEVKQIRYEAVTVSNVVTYDAVITVDNDRLKLRPGMTANVTFVIDERNDVLVVPNKALRYRPPGAPPEERSWKKRGEGKSDEGKREGGKADEQSRAERIARRPRTVYVLRDGQAVPVRLRLGLSDGTNTEVVEVVEGEFAEGDEIIVGNAAAPGAAPTKGAGGRPQMGRLF